MSDIFKLLRRPVAAVLRALTEGSRSGVLELQLATDTGLSVERVHGIVNELARLGVVVHEDSANGYLIRLNPSSPLLVVLGDTSTAPRTGTNLADRLRMPGADVSVVYRWEGRSDRPPLLIATVDDALTDAELELVIHELQSAAFDVLPAEPLVRVYRWTEYYTAYNDGDENLVQMWQAGTQLAGRDPLCHGNAIEALRRAVDPHRLRSIATEDRPSPMPGY